MSKKPVRPVKPPPANTSTAQEQEHTAQIHLEKGRYRDAIAGFKALLKTERRPEWLAALASAYGGRAKGLAAKGLLEEAIALWRSRAELCGTPLWEGPYAGWLISAGRLADVLDYLSSRRVGGSTAADAQPNEEITRLEAQLAPALLVANDTTLTRLPADSLLLLHRPAALAALSAYADKDAAALENALTNLPFRSPYRDLRSLLKALVLWETDPESARLALARVPPDGPFEQLAAPLRTLLLVGTERLRFWASLNSAQQAMVLDLLGCPPAFAPLLRAIAEADAQLAPAALFELVQRHSRDLPKPLATAAWQWLAPWATRRGCDNPRIFGNPTTTAQECATALAVEITGDWDHAESHWSDAADLLCASGDTQDKLRAALVLRHMALSPAHLSSDGLLDPEGEEMLERSLKLDVNDCAAQILMTQHWRRKGELKRAREQLDVALAHFGEDAGLLTEAVETALAAGSFKKAATTARRLLELDPLNPKVRSLLGNAHLSHAVKQIATAKPDAAKKEIVEAATWLGSAADQGRIYLLQAWTEPAGSAERLRLARLAASTWGGGLGAGWRLLREAQGVFVRFDRQRAIILLSEAGLRAETAITPAELMDLVPVLEQAEPMIRKGTDPLVAWRLAIHKIASMPAFDARQTERICEAFSRHKEQGLLESFANAARKRWPDQPIFVYHAVAARFYLHHSIKSERDFQALENAGRQASALKDMRLVMRIDALIDDDASRFGFTDAELGLPAFPKLPKLPKSPFDLANLPPEAFRALMEETIKLGGEKSFLQNSRRDLGEAVYRQIERECAGNKKLFVSRILDLIVDLFYEDVALVKPAVPVKNHQNKPAAPGQGSLFDE